MIGSGGVHVVVMQHAVSAIAATCGNKLQLHLRRAHCSDQQPLNLSKHPCKQGSQENGASSNHASQPAVSREAARLINAVAPSLVPLPVPLLQALLFDLVAAESLPAAGARSSENGGSQSQAGAQLITKMALSCKVHIKDIWQDLHRSHIARG